VIAEKKAVEAKLKALEAELAAVEAKRKYDEGLIEDKEEDRGDGDWISDDERFTPSKEFMKSEDYWYEFSDDKNSDYYNRQL